MKGNKNKKTETPSSQVRETTMALKLTRIYL